MFCHSALFTCLFHVSFLVERVFEIRTFDRVRRNDMDVDMEMCRVRGSTRGITSQNYMAPTNLLHIAIGLGETGGIGKVQKHIGHQHPSKFRNETTCSNNLQGPKGIHSP